MGGFPGITVTEYDESYGAKVTTGRYAAIAAPTVRGPLSVTLVSSQAQLKSLYSWDGYFPEVSLSTQRSGYFAALNALLGTNSLWFRRVVPSDALSSTVYLIKQGVAPLALTLTTGTPSTDEVKVHSSTELLLNATTGFREGEAVVVQGYDLPLGGLVNGGTYYVSEDDALHLSLYPTYADAVAETNAIVFDTITGHTGSGIVYFYLAGASLRGGMTAPEDESIDVSSSDAALLYASNPGSWGDRVGVVVEVPRTIERDIHLTEAVDVENGEFPVASTWWGVSSTSNDGAPVKFILNSTGADDVLPTGIEADTPVYVVRKDTTHFQVADSITDAINVSPAVLSLTDSGIGTAQVITPATVAAVALGGADALANLITVDKPIVAGTKVYLVKDDAAYNLPDPLSIGTAYYIKTCTSTAPYQLTLSLTASGDAVSLTGLVAYNSFTIVAVAQAETVVNANILALSEAETFSSTADSGGYFTSQFAWPDGTEVTLSESVSGALPYLVPAGSVYTQAKGTGVGAKKIRFTSDSGGVTVVKLAAASDPEVLATSTFTLSAGTPGTPWGAGSVGGTTSGSNLVDARFALAVSGGSGTFTATFKGQTTTAIAYNADAATILAALEALSNVDAGDVAVTKPASDFLITFIGRKGAQPIALTTEFSTVGTAGCTATSTLDRAGINGNNKITVVEAVPAGWVTGTRVSLSLPGVSTFESPGTIAPCWLNVSGSTLSFYSTRAYAIAGDPVTGLVSLGGAQNSVAGTLTVTIAPVSASTVTVTAAETVVAPNALKVSQQWAKGTKVQATIIAGGVPATLSGLVAATDYYAVDATDPSEPDTYLLKFATTLANAEAGVVVDLDPTAGTVYTITLTPQLLTEATVDLSGAVDYENDTIHLNPLASGSFQEWVPGEPVRLSLSSVTGSLPSPLTGAMTYFVVPVAPGIIKLARASAPSSVEDLSIVHLSANTPGVGVMEVAAIQSPLGAGTFRVKVYKRITQRAASTESVDTWVSAEAPQTCSLYSEMQDGNGRNLFIDSRLQASTFVSAVAPEGIALSTSVMPRAVPFVTGLFGGANGGATAGVAGSGDVTAADMILALQDFTNTESTPVYYFLEGGFGDASYQQSIITLCETRMDSVALLSSPINCEGLPDSATRIVRYRNDSLPSSSYGAIFAPWQNIPDASTGKDVLCAPDGLVAARMSQVDASKGPWAATAGTVDGLVNSNGAITTFTSADTQLLYANGINPLIPYQGVGTAIWGNKTLYSFDSALNRLNVRKLFNTIEMDLRVALRPYVYKAINQATFNEIKAVVDAYMTTIRGKGGVMDWKTVCDDSNNTAADSDNETINCYLFVRPTKVAEYIGLTVIVTSAGISFANAQTALGAV